MRLDRWSDDATMAAFERADKDCRERTLELANWVRDSGSVDVRALSGSVERRFKYLAVIGSWLTGGDRGEGVSK